MNARAVYESLAAYLQMDLRSLNDDLRLSEDLGLDPLDLVMVTMDLQDRELFPGEFPFANLDVPRTVGELVTLYRAFCERDTLDLSLAS
jgi:acyl carrier protein